MDTSQLLELVDHLRQRGAAHASVGLSEEGAVVRLDVTWLPSGVPSQPAPQVVPVPVQPTFRAPPAFRT